VGQLRQGDVEAIRHFVESDLAAAERAFLGGDADLAMQLMDEARQEVRARGWWLPQLPEALGGWGLSLAEFSRVAEELGRSPLGHLAFHCQAPDAGNMELLAEFSSPRQREQFLMPLVRGEVRSCFSMTEPDRPGSNPTWMDARAVRDGDRWILNGRKWFSTAADGAAFAIVMAVTDEAAPRHRQASMFLVPRSTPGFSLVENLRVMGERGVGAMSHAEVTFQECALPQEYLLGEEGEGFVMAQHRLGPGRIHHCMRWLGICERALSLMCERAVSRALTPTRMLAEEGVVQAWIAESRIEIEAARAFVLQTARAMEADGAPAQRQAVSAIKVFVAGVLQRVLDRAIQVHGAAGLTDQTPLAFWYAHERGARIYDGPDEVHRRVIARAELSRYRREGR
jgi:acyl-CoA dehydrogenase